MDTDYKNRLNGADRRIESPARKPKLPGSKGK